MSEHAVPMSARTSRTEVIVNIIVRAVLVAASTIVIITLHESIHLVVGRLAGIPAVFTGLTSAGLPKSINPHLYGPTQLALMNGLAPLLTVIFGFVVYYLLARKSTALGHLRYFFTWWAIFGIPYLGVQMILCIQPSDYSGNGADSAAVAGYLHLPMLIRAIICLAGYLYFMVSAVWVTGAILAADRDVQPQRSGLAVPGWRQLLGWLMIALALISAVWLALRALHGSVYGPIFLVWIAWAIGTALSTPWKSYAARIMLKHWLLPGIVGMLALIPLGLIGKGNDYVSIWFIISPPLIAATLFAARDVAALRHILRLACPHNIATQT